VVAVGGGRSGKSLVSFTPESGARIESLICAEAGRRVTTVESNVGPERCGIETATCEINPGVALRPSKGLVNTGELFVDAFRGKAVNGRLFLSPATWVGAAGTVLLGANSAGAGLA